MDTNNENSVKRLKSKSSSPPLTLSTPSTTNTPQWKDLPTLEIILDYLPLKAAKESSLVCKNWYTQTLSHRFKSIGTLSLLEFGISKDKYLQHSEDALADEYIKPLVKHSNLVKTLIINNLLIDRIYTKLFTTLANLTDIYLYYFNIPPTLLLSITSNCPNMERLTFKRMSIINDSTNSSQLKSIQFPNSLRYLYFDHSFINLKTGIDENFLINHDNISTFKWVISDEQFLKPLIKSYPPLKHLQLKTYNNPETRHVICNILEHNPQISQLDYKGKPIDKTLDLILHQMTQIEDLTFLAYLSSSKYKFKTKTNQILKYLNLSQYRHDIIQVTKALLSNCPNLETLVINIGYRRDQVMDLIADNCPKLRDLTLIEDLMDFPYRQPVDSWKSQIVDLDLINREFQCAKILNRLQLTNIMITKQGIETLQQFPSLKEVRFEIGISNVEDDALIDFIEDYLDDMPNTTLYQDLYEDSITGCIHYPNLH